MGFFHAVQRKIDVDIADFTLRSKYQEILRYILNWFVGLDLGKIFPKNTFYYWHVIEKWNAVEL